ncbi:HlyD family secretion protein [Ahniella affigens]|uniref:HlyD family secretion protein n=2 Tax=Ahniella affigens TaxID=2021234 RepID=A0A2P1PQW1_9GAMM|nr:HlyD family secretion protein [Ahniella affigens]
MSTWMKFILALSLAIALTGAWWLGRFSAGSTAPAAASVDPTDARDILYYRNPMGLADTSAVPKKDSMGMDYIPVYADQAPMAPGSVALTPEKVQRLGVQTAPATRTRLAQTVRASATVEVDETKQFVVAPRFEGWIETLYANQTGLAVKRGQTLAALYSPELFAALEEARIAEAAAAKLDATDPSSAATMRRLRDASRTRLSNWQVSDAALDAAGKGRLLLKAPANAVVVEKLVVQGDRFEPGQTILRLADLSTVWVVANVPAGQLGRLAVGDAATFTTPSAPGREFAGQVTFLEPILDRASRSVRVRIALANADGVLRPGLFGDALLTSTPGEPSIVVPRSAILDSGTRQIALVEVGPGRFEPREVRLGARSGDRVAVLDGLRDGETVVTYGNFLIDAESNLGAAMQGMSHGAQSAVDTGAETNHSGHDDTASATKGNATRDAADQGTPSPAHSNHGEAN